MRERMLDDLNRHVDDEVAFRDRACHASWTCWPGDPLH
jgi:hypothetical protein